jgi:hypothetical protein
MEIFLLLFLFFIGGLFGWLCADVVWAIKEKDSRKSWLGWVVAIVGLMYMVVGGIYTRYVCDHYEYNYDKYEIVRDTTITNHNGQIDTTATFKVVRK